jgi:uncharacterized protein YdeI (YjbR/CyaY-like superfamily)
MACRTVGAVAARARYFRSQVEFRAWLREHHASADEVLVGFHKTATGKPSMTWAQSVDEVLCFGWIDGLRKSVDDDRYTIRFTPRRERSIWSQKNITRFRELDAAGLVHSAGRAAFDARDEERTRRYSFEQGRAELPRDQEREFRANKAAWAFFQSQPPSYRKPAIWWVISARKEDTRARRLAALIDDSANGVRIRQLRRT